MDKLDYRILNILKENGRETASDISKAIHLSVSAVLDRIKKMEEAGIIKGYTVRVDAKALGNDVTALMEISLEHPRFHDSFTEVILEHPNILRLNCRKLCAAVMSGQIVEQNTAGHEHRAEYKIHENVGCKVENGAGGSNPNHKTAYTGGIPFPGLCDKFLIHVIPRNRGTGQVVNQIQENQMHAHHRQEGQQCRSR